MRCRNHAALREVKAIGLDGYGTVFNFLEPDFIATIAEICGRFGIEADAADVWRRFVRASYQLRAEHHQEPVYRRYDDAWTLQFERVFRQLKVKADARKASEHFKGRLADAPAFDEVPAVLEALRPRYRVALLSNADDDFLHACLRRNRLEFEIVLSSENVGAIKPSREVFDYLAATLELPPGQVLYVGDSPVPDVLGPKSAGMLAAWVNRLGYRRPRRAPEPDVRVRTLAELVPLLVPALD